MFVLGLFALLAFWIVRSLIGIQEHGAELMNLAGRQRMLTQRIALTAERLLDVDPSSRLKYQRDLRHLLDLFESSHRRLIATGVARDGLIDNSPAVTRLYFDRTEGVANEVEKFVNVYRSVAERREFDRLEMLRTIHAYDSERILEKLEKIVVQYQNDLEESIHLVNQGAVLLLILTFLLLILETLFIFRPMVQKIKQLFSDLSAREREARSAAMLERDSQRFLRMITNNIPGLVAYWSADLRCRFANNAYLEWFGRTQEEMIGIKMDVLLGEELFRLNYDYIQGALAGNIQQFERTIKKTDGTFGYTWAQYVPDISDEAVLGFFVLVSDITVLKETEIRLTERLELSLAAAGIGAWSLDLKTGVAWRSQNVAHIYGFQDLPGNWNWENVMEHVIAEDRERFIAEFDSIRTKGKLRSEFRFCQPNTGEIRWLLLQSTTFFASDGTPTQAIGILSDVTNERESARVQSNALLSLRLATSASKMGFFYVDTETGGVEYSDELQSILGVQMTGDRDRDREDFYAAVAPQHKSLVQKSLVDFYDGKMPQVDLEYLFISETKGNMWVHLFMRAARISSSGKPLYIVAYVQDISEQHAASDRLRSSERRLMYALEGSSDGIWDWDLKAQEFYVSDKLAERFGGPSIRRIDTSTSFVENIHPDDVARVVGSIENHLGGVTAIHECEARLRMSDGTWNWFLSRGKISEYDERGAPARMTGVHIDISDLKLAQEIAEESRRSLKASRDEIERQNSELRLANESKSRFLATMSHEIRTPMNGVLGMAELLSSTPLNADQRDLVRIIQQSGATLLALINDILDFSKIDAGKLKIEVVAFSLASVVETQVEMLYAEAYRKGISLQGFIEPGMPLHRMGDAGRISQILVNLIGNAIKFTTDGGVQVVARRTENSLSDLVRFEVKDTGIGLSQTQISSLFQPFTQADSSTSRKYGGTGLGLSICKGIVEAMGGQIGIESVEGSGSTFWFELPLALALDSDRKEGEKARQGQSMKVAVVASTRGITEVLSSYIESWGMQACVYQSVKELEAKILRDPLENRPALAIIEDSSVAPDEVAFKSLKDKFGDDFKIIALVQRRAEIVENPKKGVDAVLHLPIAQSHLFDAIVSGVNSSSRKVNLSEHAIKKPIDSSVKILVAEDNATNQLLIRRLLEALGYSCHLVANGLEAVKAAEQLKYHVILMDCHMPEMDGYEASRKIRSFEGNGARTPIIAVTANALEGDDRLCLEAGMDDYITKPINKNGLNAKLMKWLPQKTGDSL